MITHSDYLFLMKHLPILENLSIDRRLLLCIQRTVRVHYTEGVEIQCSHTGAGLILVKKGSLRIYLLSREGREITLYNLQSGDVCIISTKLALQLITFEAHIDAESDCEALLLDSDSFAGLCDADAAVELYFSRLLTSRMSLSVQILERALSLSIEQRLAAFLTDELTIMENHNIVLTHDRIARHIGSTREVVTRTLNHFATRGLVKLTRGNVEILDRVKLNRLAFQP